MQCLGYIGSEGVRVLGFVYVVEDVYRASHSHVVAASVGGVSVAPLLDGVGLPRASRLCRSRIVAKIAWKGLAWCALGLVGASSILMDSRMIVVRMEVQGKMLLMKELTVDVVRSIPS